LKLPRAKKRQEDIPPAAYFAILASACSQPDPSTSLNTAALRTKCNNSGAQGLATAVAFAGINSLATLVAGLATAEAFTGVLTLAAMLAGIIGDRRGSAGGRTALATSQQTRESRRHHGNRNSDFLCSTIHGVPFKIRRGLKSSTALHTGKCLVCPGKEQLEVSHRTTFDC